MKKLLRKLAILAITVGLLLSVSSTTFAWWGGHGRPPSPGPGAPWSGPPGK